MRVGQFPQMRNIKNSAISTANNTDHRRKRKNAAKQLIGIRFFSEPLNATINAMGWFFSDPLLVGSEAPDFTMPDEAGTPVHLKALRPRNVVLVFYPGDNTPVCRAQLCEFRDRWEQAKMRNTVVFGINPGNAASHAGFREKNKLPFPLLVDSGQKVGSLYHAGGLIVKRTVYLIGPTGLIRYAQRGKPSVEDVLAKAV